MKISASLNNQQYNNAPQFTAVRSANYRVLKDKIQIMKLNKYDVDYIKYVTEKLPELMKKHDVQDESRKQVMEEAFNACAELLTGKKSPEDKSSILLALSNNEPCGILIGNVPKSDKARRVHYSSRKNHAKDETELDWLATWNKDVKGVGKALVTEFFNSLKTDGFKSVYVRSEVPEKSCAKYFYEAMGFKPISESQQKIVKKGDNNYLIGQFDEPNDCIIPMKATSKRITATVDTRNEELQRTATNSIYNYDLLNLTRPISAN